MAQADREEQKQIQAKNKVYVADVNKKAKVYQEEEQNLKKMEKLIDSGKLPSPFIHNLNKSLEESGKYIGGGLGTAIGALAGRKEQEDYAVAVGYHAGQGYQGSSAVAIGKDAGRGVNLDTIYNNSEGDYPTVNWVSGGASGTTTFIVDDVTNIFPGMQAIGTNLNNCYVTAINTQTKEITISPGTSGDLEGNTPTISFYGYQGANAIAIGAYAGASVQHPNSVIINASGTEVNSAGTGTLVIQSLRQVSGGSIPSGFYQVAWNPTTGEMIAITP